MQEITIASVTEKTTRAGDKTYWEVVDSKGTKMSCWAGEVVELKPHAVIMGELKVEGKFVNLMQWTLVKQGSDTLPPPVSKDDMTKGDWQRKDENQRRSIERQVCLKCACEIAGPDTDMDSILANAEAMYEWVSSAKDVPFVKSAPKSATSKPVVQKTAPSGEITNIKSAGDLLTVADKAGIPAQTVRELVGATTSADLINWNLEKYKGDWNLAWAEILTKWRAQ